MGSASVDVDVDVVVVVVVDHGVKGRKELDQTLSLTRGWNVLSEFVRVRVRF